MQLKSLKIEVLDPMVCPTTFLQRLTCLRSVTIDVNSVLPKLGGLRELKHFAWLGHRRAHPVNVSSFGLCTSLLSLVLGKMSIRSLAPLASCLELQDIEFHEWTELYPVDIRPLSACMQLKHLAFVRCHPKSVQGISELKSKLPKLMVLIVE